MTSLQLSVALFFWGSAVVVGIDAIKADGLRRTVLWLLTSAFAAAGFLVRPLWEVFPDVSAALVGLVQSPVAWFVLAALAYVVLRAPGDENVAVPPSAGVDERSAGTSSIQPAIAPQALPPPTPSD